MKIVMFKCQNRDLKKKCVRRSDVLIVDIITKIKNMNKANVTIVITRDAVLF